MRGALRVGESPGACASGFRLRATGSGLLGRGTRLRSNSTIDATNLRVTPSSKAMVT
ncbi:MAG: hypothetical protein IT177_13835 [Acidobacteria bacterium]|nr:hypothetical protein [Acidobacteriota bacterium]